MTGGPIAGRYTGASTGGDTSAAHRDDTSAAHRDDTSAAHRDESRRLQEVLLLALPVALFLRTRQHHDELLRELTLLALAYDDHVAQHPLPARLAALVEMLGRRHGATASRADAVRDAAIEHGDPTVDLTYQVPSSIAADLTMLQEMLDAADEFCRSGELLTLPRDHTMVSFSHWYSDEFIRQLDGLPPTPWTGALT